MLAPADSKALVGVARRRSTPGIVVVNIDNRLDRDAMAERRLTVPFVGPDNRAGALAVGAYVATRLKAGDPIAILEGAPNAFNGIERTRGFEDAAREAGLTDRRDRRPRNWETARASQVVSALVTEQPGVKAILCANDSMALGAVAALKAAGRQGTRARRRVRQHLGGAGPGQESGEIVATADQHGDQLAVYGIEYALQQPAQRLAPLAGSRDAGRSHHRRSLH